MKSMIVVRNIRMTVRKSPRTLSISSNSASMVVKRTMGVSAVGAVSADTGANVGVGLDLSIGVDVDAMMRER